MNVNMSLAKGVRSVLQIYQSAEGNVVLRSATTRLTLSELNRNGDMITATRRY